MAGILRTGSGATPGARLLPTHPPNAAWEIAGSNVIVAIAALLSLTIIRIRWHEAGIRRAGTLAGLLLGAPVVGLNVVAWLSPAGGAMQLPSSRTLLGYLLLASCIALGEELFYRGALLQVLDPARNPNRAVAVSALLFGAFHVIEDGRLIVDLEHAANAVATTLAMGVPFALIRLRTGSLWGLVICHALYDFVALIVSDGFSGQGVTPLDATLSVIVAAMTCGLYLWWFRSSGGYAARAGASSSD